MLKTALKDLWAKKIRLVTTGIAVLLGVAFMSGTLVFTDTIGRTFQDLFEGIGKNTDEQVRAKETIHGNSFHGTLDSTLGATFVGMNDAAAQQHFAEPGKFDAVDVVAKDGVSQEALRDRIAAALPKGDEVITGTQLIKENQDDIQKGIGFFKN